MIRKDAASCVESRGVVSDLDCIHELEERIPKIVLGMYNVYWKEHMLEVEVSIANHTNSKSKL
jgi:hypothetical protein